MRWLYFKTLLMLIVSLGTFPSLSFADTSETLLASVSETSDQRSDTAQQGSWKTRHAFTRLEFIQAYEAAADARSIFERYIDTLGPAALMEFLEGKYPLCHAEAHELGQVLWERLKHLKSALTLCGHGCTNGCMHGVLSKALGQIEPAAVDRLMEACEGQPSGLTHKRGNCAHAIGHGLLLKTERDREWALDLCARLFEESLEYYCATGVFMEYWGNLPEQDTAEEEHRNELYLTCQSTAFPAACYRYLIDKLGSTVSPEDILEQCLSLSGQSRLGCFHGFGTMYAHTVGERPAVFPAVCTYGTLDDQTVCIEGVIEKVADHDEERARTACTLLESQAAQICWAAAREKMYRLDKPSMRLYLR
jgi:hypothetical protein